MRTDIIPETLAMLVGNWPAAYSELGLTAPARGHRRCPLGTHPDRSPSFRIDWRSGKWFCSCAQGDLLDAAIAVGYAPSPIDACRRLRQAFNLPPIAGDIREETPQQRAERERERAALMRVAGEQRRQDEAEDAANRAKALAWIRGPLFERVQNVDGSLAEAYLLKRFGGHRPERWPDALGYVDSYGVDQLPAMVGFFGIFEEYEHGRLAIDPARIAGAHITYIDPDTANKARDSQGRSKLMVGRGHALPLILAPAGDSLTICIAEGVEKGLAWSIATGWGCWIAGSANRMPALAEQIPKYVEVVNIVADPDPAGQRYSRQLADTLAERGDVEVNVVRRKATDGA